MKDLLSVDTHGKNEYTKYITPIKEKNKGKSEIITVKEHRALFARCAMLINSERGVDMISSFELGYPRSLMTLSVDFHPGHAGKAQLMHVLK